jgi:hypothetical protein
MPKRIVGTIYVPEFAESSTAIVQGLCNLYGPKQIRLQVKSQEADRSGVFNSMGVPVEVRYGCLSTGVKTHRLTLSQCWLEEQVLDKTKVVEL